MEPLRPCELDLPAYLVAGRGGVGISLIADAGLASGAALAILLSMLMQQLRHQRGLSYQVTSASEYLDPWLRHAWIAADALPDEVPMAAHVALTVLEELAADCATEQELADYVQQMRRACEALDARWQLLLSQARSHLLRGKIRDQAGMLRRAAALTSRDIATAMTDLRRQMIVVTPQVLPAVQGRMPPLRATPAAAVTGIRYPARGASGSLIIGADGVSLQGEPDLLATVRFDDLAALLRWNDGTQMLVGNDGFQIRLAAGDWNGAIQGGAGRGRGTGWQQVRQAPGCSLDGAPLRTGRRPWRWRSCRAAPERPAHCGRSATGAPRQGRPRCAASAPPRTRWPAEYPGCTREPRGSASPCRSPC
jgi:hypothetical protein